MDRKYWYWINNISGVGNRKIKSLLEYAKSAYEVYNMEEKELSNIPSLSKRDISNIASAETKKRIIDDYYRKIEEGINFVFPDEPAYPEKLKQIYDMPYIIYYKGQMKFNGRKNIAVVGSRKCSAYGRKVARELGEILADAGASVISGLASGIDGEAHCGAVLKGGYTCAVMAGGVDICYPPSHYNLYMDIIESGCVISEYPAGITVKPGMFPVRNRIISGISDAVIVVEAGHKSGSLITAGIAAEQNRDVYAVPGRIGDPVSNGCNELIADGAIPVTGYDNLMALLGLDKKQWEKSTDKNIVLASTEKMLYSLLLDFTPKNLETLVSETGLAPELVIKNLIGLEIKGIIREISKNYYIRAD